MVRNRLISAAAISALLMGATAFAEAPNSAISKEQASKIALAAVPGHIKSAELEHEGGKHVWSFDITQSGKSGATEIQVDAKTGEIVSRKEETVAEEAKEVRAEREKKSRPSR